MEMKIISANTPEALNAILEEHLKDNWTLWSSGISYLGIVNGKNSIGLILSKVKP